MSASKEQAEAGMSLVELIVVVVIAALLLGVLALIFGNGMSAQQKAGDRTMSTASINAVTASMLESVRNSTDIKASADGLRLDAKVLLADGTTWQCRAWKLEGGNLLYSSAVTARPASTAGWKSLASGVAGNLGGGKMFAQSAKQVSIGMQATQGESVIPVSDGATAQVVQAGGPACW